jgi:hypothetical protein
MFSLIVTVIAIALVVALAIATIYYGGAASKSYTSKAAANALVNQAAQIGAAGVLATTHGVAWPSSAPSFSDPYLKSMPVPPKAAYASDTPSGNDWAYLVPGSIPFGVKDKVRKDVCFAINQSKGFIGIPAAWDKTSPFQCFGRGTPTGTGELGYTFLYLPPGTTAAQIDAVSDKSIADANTGSPAITATNGYPRLCPDGSNIDTGVCATDGSVVVEPGPGGGSGSDSGGPVTSTPTPAGVFVLDTFSGTGSLATHAGEAGSTWGFAYQRGAELSYYTLDSGNLVNVDGWGGYVQPSGAPAPGSNYYVEFELAYVGASTNFSKYLEMYTSTGYMVHWYLNGSSAETEIDGWSASGNGAGYTTAPPMQRNTMYTYRVNFVDGLAFLLVNGEEVGVLYSAPKGQGAFNFAFDQDIVISKVEAGQL